MMTRLFKLLRRVDEAVFPSSLYCICCGAMIDESRSYSLCDECIRKFHWITGTTCAICGKALPERMETRSSTDAGIDEAFIGDAAAGEATHGDAATHSVSGQRLCYNCMIERPLFVRGFSCVTYGLHEREIMMDLKYAGRGYIARRCGDMMFDRIETEISHGQFSPDEEPIDIIVPVPADGDRLRERGYNQSALMADQLAKRWRKFLHRYGEYQYVAGQVNSTSQEAVHPPVFLNDLLYRTRKTRKLRTLTPAERAMELEGTFDVRNRYEEKVKGANILLVDDIYTTGATANACTKALMDSGVGRVYFLAWASGGNRRPTDT